MQALLFQTSSSNLQPVLRASHELQNDLHYCVLTQKQHFRLSWPICREGNKSTQRTDQKEWKIHSLRFGHNQEFLGEV